MKVSYRTIAEIRAANKEAGYCFFSRQTMRFFKTVVYQYVYGGRFFITRDKTSRSTNDYKVREALATGDIDTVDECRTLGAARATARELAKNGKTYEVRFTDTPGCYGTDNRGQPWTTFQYGAGVTCAECDATITEGWQCGMMGEEQYYCSKHITHPIEEGQEEVQS